jgi:opacity protein-like surface antigen
MRKILILSSGLFLLLPVVAFAGDTPVSDLSFGYSYQRLNAANTYEAGPGRFYPPRDLNMNGWNVSASWNLNNWFGLVADVGGQYDRRNFANFGISNNRTYSYLFGPRFTYRGNESVEPFVQTLFGVSQSSLRTTGPFRVTDDGFGMGIGGGIDWKLSNAIAVRVGQVDYLLTRFGKDATQNNLRFSTGLIFRIPSRG